MPVDLNRTLILAAALAGLMLATPGGAEPPPPQVGWGFSVLGGVGDGGQKYSVETDTANFWSMDDDFVNQWQWFADIRLHTPPMGSLGVRPFLIAGYTRAFGTISGQQLRTSDPDLVTETDVDFVDRWTAGLGLTFPIHSASGRTFMEVNPMLLYGRERAKADFDVVGLRSGGFGSASASATWNQIVPALELSFPVAPLGSIGNMHIAVGAQMPIDVGGSSSESVLLGNAGQASFHRDRVGYAAYVAVRLAFDPPM